MSIRSIGVIGAGAMGDGIAQVAACLCHRVRQDDRQDAHHREEQPGIRRQPHPRADDKEMVAAGRFGRKSGQGFYSYA